MRNIEDSMPQFLSEAHRLKQPELLKAVQRMQEHPLSAKQLQEQCLRNHIGSMNARKREEERKRKEE